MWPSAHAWLELAGKLALSLVILESLSVDEGIQHHLLGDMFRILWAGCIVRTTPVGVCPEFVAPLLLVRFFDFIGGWKLRVTRIF